MVLPKIYIYIIITGCVVIWSLLDWGIIKILNKTLTNKAINNFLVITTKLEENFLILATASGNLFISDLMKKDIIATKLEMDKVSLYFIYFRKSRQSTTQM